MPLKSDCTQAMLYCVIDIDLYTIIVPLSSPRSGNIRGITARSQSGPSLNYEVSIHHFQSVIEDILI